MKTGWIAIAVFWVLLVGGVLVYQRLSRAAEVGAGYVAKETCSCIFVGGRDMASCRPDVPASMDGVRAEKLPDGVRARVPYLADRTARYRPGFGCTLY